MSLNENGDEVSIQLDAALQRAIQPLIDIATGVNDHPAIQHFLQWKELTGSQNRAKKRRRITRGSEDFEYLAQHPLPISSVDEDALALSMSWLLRGVQHRQPEQPIDQWTWPYYVPMNVLLGLVIIRE